MAASFVVAPQLQHVTTSTTTTSSLQAIYTPGRSASRRNKNGRDDRSKRQFRVGEFVRTELAEILHTGLIKGDYTYLEEELRQRISIVSVDVSPDLRQARVSVSIRSAMKKPPRDDDGESVYYEDDPAVDKRRAFSWLVDNTWALKHTLAQKMSHMKTSPNLSFNRVDVEAATEVMYLIDQVSKGYERESIGEYEFLGEFDEEEDDDDVDFDDEDDWDEMDDDFFDTDE
jgi:ribosome-binding factor A